jgi:hypothetical protein
MAVSAKTTPPTGMAQPIPNADAVNLNATYMAQTAMRIPMMRRVSGIALPGADCPANVPNKHGAG